MQTDSSQTAADNRFIQACLLLAARGRGAVGNGALVGSVLVRNGRIIAEGYHKGFGQAHAERMLLETFKEPVEPDDILYVNLEPCCHHGKTPPCTDIILKRGVRTVVFGMRDPDSRVAGKGIELLRKEGVTVRGPIERAACEWMNRGFMTARMLGRPWITMKMATDRAGFISNPDGSPRKITSAMQDIWSHSFLRAQAGGILVGIGTILADNPQLTVRCDECFNIENESDVRGKSKLKSTKCIHNQPYRVILDPQFRIPQDARVVSDAYADRTIVVTSPAIDRVTDEKRVYLNKKGVRIIELPFAKDHFLWLQLWDSLLRSGSSFYGINSLLVEGGAKTWDVFRRSGMVDEEVALIGAPAGL